MFWQLDMFWQLEFETTYSAALDKLYYACISLFIIIRIFVTMYFLNGIQLFFELKHIQAPTPHSGTHPF